MESFADRLRRLRTASSHSCSDLAYRVGVTEGAIRQLESGRTKTASFTLGLKIAKVLGVDPWFLATGLSEDEGPTASTQTGSMKDRMAQLEARMERLERALAAPEVRRRPAARR